MQRMVRQNLMRRRWTRNPEEVKKLKKVKFAVETMEIEPYDAKIKNESKDAKLRQQNGRELRMDKLWNQKYRTFRFGRGWNFAARVKDQTSRANGVATSTALVERPCFLRAQSHHRYSQIVHRTLKLVTH